MGEPLQADEIAARLKTVLLGRRVLVYEKIGSTNNQAAILAAQGTEEGTLILAETQTEGKGRLGRTWFSPPSVNLYLSVIFRPRIEPAQATMLTLLAGVTVALAIRQQTRLIAQLKWPNDVLIGEKKVAGILAELAADGQIIKYLILGIGLNVNLEASMLPPELSETATSLKAESGRAVSRLDMLQTLVNQLERWYTVFLDQGATPILKEYSRLSNTIGQHIKVICPDKVVEGEAVGLALNGGLILRERDGTSTTIFTGDVVHVRRRNG
jgi:BirA family biotin operon repressor/biotin-[acetyl-CoA-carboxylase] ligase